MYAELVEQPVDEIGKEDVGGRDEHRGNKEENECEEHEDGDDDGDEAPTEADVDEGNGNDEKELDNAENVEDENGNLVLHGQSKLREIAG